MTPRQLELALKRQRLEWQGEAQRQDLQRHLQAFLPAFTAADRLRAGAQFLHAHPQWVAGAAVVVAILRPSKAWRWTKRGFFAWRLWKKLQDKLGAAGMTHAP